MKTKDFSGIRNNGPLPNATELELPDDIGDLLEDYIESTTASLEQLEYVTLTYESTENHKETAAAIKRILHKIKGESSMVGVEDMSEFCHQTEYAFEELPENKRPDMLLRFKDWTFNAINSIER